MGKLPPESFRPDAIPPIGFFRDASEACKRQFEVTGKLDV